MGLLWHEHQQQERKKTKNEGNTAQQREAEGKKNEAKVQRTHRNVGMDVVLLAVATDEAAA